MLNKISTVLLKSRAHVRGAKACQLNDISKSYATQASQIVSLKKSSDVDGVAIVSLNHPAVKNALSKSLVGEFSSILEDASRDTSIRALIIRSLVPGVFCAGADLKERLNMSQDEVGSFVDSLRSLSCQIEALPMPTIAALDGAALGGGLEMALSCDMRVIASTAKLGLIETRLAIIPGAGGTQRLPRLVGLAKAKELIFCAKVIDGIEAERLGIANIVVEQNKSRDAAARRSLELAAEIACQGPIALRMAKQAINKGVQVDISSSMDIEKSCYAQVIPTKDRIEGLKAFVEKRSPSYKGE
ncbi:Enoyl-CoA hydratase domain-containing protein 2, mitochondrial [Halotydeus destructor]|nr:Enoyl-CoA hydratase domain-containing protein 2, mitochondrial [Halotydeus destructor]